MEKLRKIIKNKDFIFILALVLVIVLCVGILNSQNEEIDESQLGELPYESNDEIYQKLVISEIVSNNGGIYADENGDCLDYIEIYNGSSKDINLFGYGLSDRKDKIKWTFPNVSIKSKEYMIICLAGDTREGLYANFKLSSKGGENIILTNLSGKVIDSVKTIAQEKNQSQIRYQRELTLVNFATPGFENSEKGYEAYIASLYGNEEYALVVNELLPNGKSNYDGGFIEFKNDSENILDLSTYSYGFSLDQAFEFDFGNQKLNPGEIIVFDTGKASNKKGTVYIANSGKIVSSLEYENLTNGCAYTLGEGGIYYVSSCISPGLPNTLDGIKEYQKSAVVYPNGLLINEVMNLNSTYLPQNGAQYYDWIELYNSSNEDIRLADYCLSADDNNLSAYKLPDVTLSPGEYYIIMCSGDEALSNSQYIHANFKLGTAEDIYLTKNNKVMDKVYIYGIPTNYSYARGTDFGWTYSNTPTPGTKNIDGYYSITPVPAANYDSGIYEGEITLCLFGEGDIYYTLDGSIPTTNSLIYKEPITLSSVAVVKFAAVLPGQRISEYETRSYIINDAHNMPVVSLTMDPDEYDYLYSHPKNYDLIYKGLFEIFEEDSSAAAYCGVSLSGNTGRLYNKKNYALHFEGEYGDKSLNYKLFDDVDCSSFDSIVLRGGSNAEMSLPWKDEFATTLARGYVETRSYKTCVLYINGEYAGVFNIREKITPGMIAAHYNVSKNSVNIIRWNGDLESGEDVWTPIMNWGIENDLSNEDNYDYFCSLVDVEELIDLWIFEMYIDNPDLYNIRVFSSPEYDNGRIHFIYFDLDLGFYSNFDNYLTDAIFNESGYVQDLAYHKYSIKINNALLENEQFRQLFKDRVAYHLANSLSNENALKVFDEFTALYADEIERDMNANGYTTDWYKRCITGFRRQIAVRAEKIQRLVDNFLN